MILTGKKITEEFNNARIDIRPFDPAKVTTNSYDLSLGAQLIRYTGEVLDPKIENPYEVIKMGPEGYQMQKGDFLLGHSREIIGSDHYVPLIHAKSGAARLGLFVHVTADLIDIGSHGQTTFQLHSTLPVKVYPGMKLEQVTFWKPDGEIELYQGKYQNSSGPQVSRIHNDFKQGPGQ